MPESVVDELTNATLSDFPVHCSYRTTSLYQPMFHSHNGFELYLCLQGNGSFIAGERIHELGAGTFTVVKPKALHLPRPNTNVPFHRYVLAVQRSYLENLYAEDRDCSLAIRQWLPKPDSDSVHSRLNARQLLSLQETLAQLELEITRKQPCYPLIVKSLLLQLFAQLGRYQSESGEGQGGTYEQKRLVENILGYIMEHHHQPLRTENLCGRFHLSRSYLFRIFKQNTGVSINEFLVAYRINKAKDFLQGTELPITEVAATVGFQDISHFCHTFKRFSGMTPSRYRSAHNGCYSTRDF
ncbi:AraC family transcriptional regulator [Cohnella luojiensis]|uniref:AraC family transcriptional regulator n=1 Tax=Cohnella luojiensis TaxID=652876 RepID=A0A4Y8LPM5_9BACL|nr:AraC family transcriptional regulator [Cohnella luojiensis]TFE19474.1 AraC family transcriptional regulator [Cohnella luojiensis]